MENNESNQILLINQYDNDQLNTNNPLLLQFPSFHNENAKIRNGNKGGGGELFNNELFNVNK